MATRRGRSASSSPSTTCHAHRGSCPSRTRIPTLLGRTGIGRFISALIGACGSSILIGICKDLMDQAQRYRFISVASSHRYRNTVEEHRGIMEAVLDRKTELAVEQLIEHYQTTLRHIEEQIQPSSRIKFNPPSLG